MIEDGCISYDTEATQKYVEGVLPNCNLIQEDMATIRDQTHNTVIRLVDTGQQYSWVPHEVRIQYSIESLAHELHHAAQHAMLGDTDSAVFTSKKGRLALEVSALATGEHQAKGNATRKVLEMLPLYHKLDAYSCDGGVEAALAYAYGKKHMAYSKARLDALGIVEAACK